MTGIGTGQDSSRSSTKSGHSFVYCMFSIQTLILTVIFESKLQDLKCTHLILFLVLKTQKYWAVQQFLLLPQPRFLSISQRTAKRFYCPIVFGPIPISLAIDPNQSTTKHNQFVTGHRRRCCLLSTKFLKQNQNHIFAAA